MDDNLEDCLEHFVKCVNDGYEAKALSDGYRFARLAATSRDTSWEARRLLVAEDQELQILLHQYLPISWYFTPDELGFSINLGCFEEHNPIFGYAEDDLSKVRIVSGLEPLPDEALPEDTEMWSGDSKWMKTYRATQEPNGNDEGILVTGSVGEFIVEIYHKHPAEGWVRIFVEDYCLK